MRLLLAGRGWTASFSASKTPCSERQETSMMRALITLGRKECSASHSMMLAAPATRRFSSLGFHDVFGPQSTTAWNFWRRSWRIAVGWWQAVIARPQLWRCGSRWACSSSHDEINKTCSPENDKAQELGSSAAVLDSAAVGNFSERYGVGALSTLDVCFFMGGRASGAGICSQSFVEGFRSGWKIGPRHPSMVHV